MRHHSLPLTMTPEALADYIRSNRIETQNHVEKIKLNDEEKRDLAMKSSSASRQIRKLEILLKEISTLIKKGTPWNTELGTDGDHVPVPITIPPTAGIDVLKSNREYADNQIEKGYREEITAIYFLPWPEFEKILAVDIEGNQWTEYTRDMNSAEIRQYGKPILSAAEDVKDILEKSGLEVEKVKGNTVKIAKKKKSLLADNPLVNEPKEDEDNDSDIPKEEDKIDY